MENRIKILREKMTEKEIDGVYLTSRTNHRYFTKLDNEDGALLITKTGAYAFEDFRYTEIAEKLLKDCYTVIQPKGKRSEWLGNILKKEGVKKLGIEDYSLSVFAYENLKNDISAELVSIGALINQMREIKDSWEVEQMEKAQVITDMAFEHILGILSTNMTETDVAAELEYFMRKHGAEDKSFETISISAEKTSLPHGVPENIKLKKGFFTMDFGATVNGYHSDMTRTVCIGKADEEMKKLYNTVLDAQLRALEYLEKGGRDCVEADKTARDIIYKDYEGYFGHSLGHSVGLEVHEMPALSPKCNRILNVGNIVTVEPGIYIPSKYGTRIEDMVLITENGIKNFTKSSKKLIEL
ncbi:MAG: aminopeptidase P family protein [Clostridia bacterium]|nr:aminopeptidase P family protein [Clostridia bacterium]